MVRCSVSVTGGMALWAGVADGIELGRWCQDGEKLGVLFRGAGMVDYFRTDLRFLRLGFTYHDETELAEAAARMARALKHNHLGASPLAPRDG